VGQLAQDLVQRIGRFHDCLQPFRHVAGLRRRIPGAPAAAIPQDRPTNILVNAPSFREPGRSQDAVDLRPALSIAARVSVPLDKSSADDAWTPHGDILRLNQSACLGRRSERQLRSEIHSRRAVSS
jgi:hypothetical protein